MQQKNFTFLAKVVTGFLLEKNLRGQKTIDHCFKTKGYCSYSSFYCFFEILGGQTSFRGKKSFLGAPPVAESQVIL